MNQDLKSVYKTYAKKCKEAKLKPVSKEDFVAVAKKQQTILTYQVKLGCTSPWIISKIDPHFVLYVSASGGAVTINVWSNMECEAMTGIKTDGKK